MHAARGAMHTAVETERDLQALTVGVVTGTVRAVGGSATDPMRIIRRAAQGIAQGAYESDADMYIVAASAMDAAREMASEIGIDGDAAEEQAIEGMMEAAEEMQGEAQAELRNAVRE